MGRIASWSIALLALPSCIIWLETPDEPDRTELPGPAEPAPLPNDLYLVIDDGRAGERVFTTLKTRDAVGFEGLQAVRFERDVTVVDAVFGRLEADLVIAIGEAAEPGAIDVVAQFREGAVVRVGDAFTIRPALPDPTGDTGSTTASGDTGAASTGDTGVVKVP